MRAPVELTGLGRQGKALELPSAASGPSATVARSSSGVAFSDLLSSELARASDVTFSAHAVERMQSRNVMLCDADQVSIGKALDMAAAKGARETLLIMDSATLVASVPNRKVITVLGADDAQNRVFTNIDSAVVVHKAQAMEQL